MKKIILFALAVWLLVACGNEKFETTIKLPYNNYLRPVISFQSSSDAPYYIEYWRKGNPFKVQKSRTSKGTTHAISLVNLKGATTYEYTINNEETGGKSVIMMLQTEEVPYPIIKPEKVLIDTTLFEGYILLRRLDPLGSDVILDKYGDVVWYHKYDSIVRRGFRWTRNNTVISHVDSSRIVEYDVYGDKLLDLELDKIGTNKMVHHDLLITESNQVLTLTFDSAKLNLQKFGGREEQYMMADGIVLLDRDGKNLWEWNLLDVYDPVANPIGTINLTQTLGHANSLDIAGDGNYVVSFRDFSQVWKINSKDGSVMWKLGKGGDFQMDEAGYFIGQHSVSFDHEGNLILFDNGDRRTRRFSRILRYKLDEKAMKAELVTNIALTPELSAPKMCSAEILPDGNFLVCTSKGDGVIAVVNADGEILWKVVPGSPSYRAYYIANPFN